MKKILVTVVALIGITGSAFAEGVCEGSDRKGVCLKMRHMRASINALDSQRELMQVNPTFFASLGLVLRETVEKIRLEYGLGIPEHLMGLTGVERLGGALATQAASNDIEMLKTANSIRMQCASCHASTSVGGGVDWENIFNYDWDEIAKHCNRPESNPYLCRSMNGMLSAYGYLITANQSQMLNFAMTRQSADEIVRILVDLKAKGFYHLPEDLRDQAEAEAREVSQMAADRSPEVFERASRITNACQQCHDRRGGPEDIRPLPLGKFSWKRSS
jgi:hypothetical protein